MTAVRLSGKKLLVLGSTTHLIDVVRAAQKMGVYVVVADWNELDRAPAKQVADEYWNISIRDYEKISEKIREQGVQGIITGFADSYLLPYQHLCEVNGFPCYATKEVFETTLDKARFKKLCRDNAVPVVPEYDLRTFLPNQILTDGPVIIKPVDNSGSRGICKCCSPQDFDRCIAYSLSFSQKKEVVIEKFMDCDTFSVSYTIQDGVISMSTMNDRLVYRTSDAGSVTAGGLYPSRYIELYQRDMDERVRAMYRKLGVQNGILFIQGFCNGSEFYFYEMGYRISGGHHYVYTKSQNNSDGLEQLVHFALMGKMADYSIASRDNPMFEKKCCQIYVLGKEDVIAAIEGVEDVRKMPEVIEMTFQKKVGDRIGKMGTTAQHIMGIYTVVDNMEQFKVLCDKIFAKIRVLNADGENLVIRVF